ncbi:hypothetical protein ACA910_016874 [Epithemia clementina (nom. ined.)]
MPSVSWSRDVRLQEEKEAKLAAEAEASLASVTAKLNSWASHRVGTLSPRYHSPRGGDDVELMKSILGRGDSNDDMMGYDDDDDEMMVDMDEPGTVQSRSKSSFLFPTTPLPPHYRQRSLGDRENSSNSRALERADTPVMSNSKRSSDDEEDDENVTADNVVMNRYSTLRKKKSIHFEDQTPSPNVHTPAPSRSKSARALANQRTPTPFINRRVPWSTTSPQQNQSLSLENRNEVRTCQRYHDSLLQFMKAKQRWVERQELADKSNALVKVDSVDDGRRSASYQLYDENTRIQVNFLENLASICYENHLVVNSKDRDEVCNSPCREGNVWNLLAHLRRFGMDALLWREESSGKYMADLERFMDQLQQKGDMTPLEVLQSLRNGKQQRHQTTTSLLERRYGLVSWLEDCFYRLLPYSLRSSKENNRKNANVEYKRDSVLFKTQGLAETEKDAILLNQSLALVLSGRLSQAQDLMRSNGLSWRAAVWGGGEAHGYEPTSSHNQSDGLAKRLTGNPKRALWQSMMWRLVEESTRSTNEEKAIASLLCNHVKASFDNPTLRTWEKALYAGLKAIVGRTEDVLLYQNANHKFAQSHLEATVDMAGMDEASLIDTLMSSPYPEMMETNDLFVTVTAGFLLGQTAVMVLLKDMEENMQQCTGYDHHVMLRFVAHLLVYLDSTMVDPESRAVTAPIQYDLRQIHDRVVVDYMRSLADREMWSMMVLYSAQLSKETMLQYLPPLLLPVTHISDRTTIVTQLREILPHSALDVLRLVVEQMQVRPKLERKDEDMEQDVNDRADNVSPDDDESDDAMMQALSWFCIFDDHAEEALVYSNSLIRRFLLQGKLETVFDFVEHVRPGNILEKMERKLDGEDKSMPDQADIQELSVAIFEHNTYESYLRAERAVSAWHECIERAIAITKAPSSPSFMNNMEEWNEVERTIAVSSERRRLVEEKQELATGVVEAANAAREALVEVLQHQGGWLWQDEQNVYETEWSRLTNTQADNNVPGPYRQNKGEWNALRKQVLPHVVMLHGQVCQETAEWMSKSLLQEMVSSFAALSREATASENTISAALVLLDPSVSFTAGSQARGAAAEGVPVNCCPFSPTYWTTQAMELADTLASDTYNIPVHEQALEHMAKLTVEHLQYSADLDQNPSL